MGRKTQWDVFISHASEDKENVVKPLVKLLSNMGVKVWYDNFSLKLGDSLSRSIDKGLSQSKYGILVISKAFIEKRWPEYELQSLVTLERAGKRTRIISIWHGISQKEVMRFSPFLADKIAENTSHHSIPEIAMRIIEVIRPDIFDNIQRLVALEKLLAKGETRNIPLSEIHHGPIRHEKLPKPLLIRISIIRNVFQEVFPISLEETIDNFRHDLRPEKEIRIWETLAAIYLKLTTEKELNIAQKKEIYAALLTYSIRPLTIEDFAKFQYVTSQMMIEARDTIVPESLIEK